MSRRLVTISYTGLDASGGVPAFNRALHAAFPERERVHYCWTDFPWHSDVNLMGMSEWDRASMLNAYLVKSRGVTTDDVVVADGFWALGLEHLPLAVSHSHGIWSHLTQDDVLAGKQPDMPLHHAAQVAFRKRWVSRKKHLTAVSNFIAEQMRLQWGFIVDRVINNGVDTEVYRPAQWTCSLIGRPLVIHGVNDYTNVNKGGDHIEAVKRELSRKHPGAAVMSLDEAFERFSLFSDHPWTKPEVLAQADVVVHPSGYEGNSMFIAEALACGVPVVGYNVGFLWKADPDPFAFGYTIDRNQRSPLETSFATHAVLRSDWHIENQKARCRDIALRELSIERFRINWRSYVEEIENA